MPPQNPTTVVPARVGHAAGLVDAEGGQAHPDGHPASPMRHASTRSIRWKSSWPTPSATISSVIRRPVDSAESDCSPSSTMRELKAPNSPLQPLMTSKETAATEKGRQIEGGTGRLEQPSIRNGRRVASGDEQQHDRHEGDQGDDEVRRDQWVGRVADQPPGHDRSDAHAEGRAERVQQGP